MAGVMPDRAEHLVAICLAEQRDGCLLVPGPRRVWCKSDAGQPEPVGSPKGREWPITPPVDGMVEATLKNIEADLRGRFDLHSPHKVFRGIGHIVDEFGLRCSETRASLIGRRRVMRVRRQ